MANIPDLDDKDGQINALHGALSSAMLTATEVPAVSLAPLLDPIVNQLHAYGIRQTDLVDPEAAHSPTWIRDGMKARSAQLPAPADHINGEPPVVRAVEAPTVPKRIPVKSRAKRISQ